MTFVEALALLKNKPASALSVEELQALRQFVHENPSIWSVAGGRDEVERYLAEAEQGRGAEAREPMPASDAGPQSSSTAPIRSPWARRTLLIGLALLLVVAVGGYLTWSRNHRVPDTRPVGPVATVAAVEKGRIKPAKSTDNVPPVPLKVRPPEVQPHSAPQAASPPSRTLPAIEPSGAAQERETSWLGWKVTLGPGAHVEQRPRWDLSDAAQPRPQTLLAATGGRAQLDAVQTIDDRHALRIVLAEVAPQGDAGQIEVRVDDQPVARFAARKAGAYLVPLEHLQGRRVRLTVAHLPSRPGDTIVWDSVSLIAPRPGVDWTVLKADKAEATEGAQLIARPDGSLLTQGANNPSQHYFVTATLPIDARAVRLEAMLDDALPAGGPGRGTQGEFSLASFSASLTESDQRRDQLPGRYVRVELPGPERRLALAEVEVFAGGKNVALRQPTAQSSVERGAFSERAVDGNATGKFDAYRPTTVMHTRTLENAWWEVDLGREQPIERISLYNGQPGQPNWTANHRVVVLDMFRQVVWQQVNPFPADPSASYGPFVTSKAPLEFHTALGRTQTTRFEAPQIVRPVANGTAAANSSIQERCDFYFPLEHVGGGQRKLPLQGRQVTFRIQHGSPPALPAAGNAPQANAAADTAANLGRFRLSVTTDPLPASPDVPMQLVSLLPGVGKRAATGTNGSTPPAPPSAAPAAASPPAAQRPLDQLPAGFAWEGWNIECAAGGFAGPHFAWDSALPEAPKLETRFSTGRHTVTLWQSRQIDAQSAWLRLRVGQLGATASAGKVEVRVDGQTIARFGPELFEAEPVRLVSLEPYVGRRMKLELVHLPGHEDEVFDWTDLGFVANPQAAGYVEWTPLVPAEVTARFATQFKILPDRSVLAVGENPAGDAYRIKTQMPAQKITAVRLEILPDASLPLFGPGRGDRGSFNLAKWSAEIVDPNRKPETKRGRFVRFEMPGKNRGLELAELEVFAGGKNVAIGKPSRQPIVLFGGTPDNANDGYVGDGHNKKGVGFAHSPGEFGEAWWEVDLGQEYDIERLVVWNRQWSGEGMADHQVVILDPQRKVVWQQRNPEIPIPCSAYEFPYPPRMVAFEAADVSFDDRIRYTTPPNPLIMVRPPTDKSVQGWHVGDVPGKLQVATATLAPDQNLSGRWVVFELGHFTPLYHNIGRFRLSVTSAPGPHVARRPVVIEPRAP